jgi:hypothetical protein
LLEGGGASGAGRRCATATTKRVLHGPNEWGTRIFAEFLPSVILTEKRKELSSFMFIALSPFVSLIAGILILIFPRLLNFIVAIHLIIVGILGLLHR